MIIINENAEDSTVIDDGTVVELYIDKVSGSYYVFVDMVGDTKSTLYKTYPLDDKKKAEDVYKKAMLSLKTAKNHKQVHRKIMNITDFDLLSNEYRNV